MSAPPGSLAMVPLIERKKRGEALSSRELEWLCSEFTAGRIPDYQVAAWLMAVRWRGMDEEETLALTRAIVNTGRTLSWDGAGSTVVDKHSTGGVGDKTTLVLVPLLAAAGLRFAKMSGRGLGHTGGTLDKLESIAGFRVDLPLEEVRRQVERIGCALVGQGRDLAPADGALYALRDVTATVDSVPLIAASVMSKKLAAGASVIILDVKHGSGAFMPTFAAAEALALAMVSIGTGAGRKVRAVLSPMEEPLGLAVGNALEVREAVAALQGGGPADLRELVLALGAEVLVLAGAGEGVSGARQKLTTLLDSGAGLDRFVDLVAAQGGDVEMVRRPELLPRAAFVTEVRSREPGAAWVSGVDARIIGEAALALGAGRRTKADRADPAAGVLLRARTGDRVAAGAVLAEVHAASTSRISEGEALVREAFRFSEAAVEASGFEVCAVG
jgi:pyrimidine-nucleoside phosphorylase